MSLNADFYLKMHQNALADPLESLSVPSPTDPYLDLKGRGRVLGKVT